MLRILVTGCAGFIGSHVAKRLLQNGVTVIGIDNLNDYYEPSLKKDRLEFLNNHNFIFYKKNLENRHALNAIFKKWNPSIVIHLAAQAGVRYSLDNPHAYIDSNIVAFTNMLEACRHHRVEHLIYASSSSVYGLNTKIPFSIHDPVDHPVSLYAATKKANELLAHTYSHLYGLPTTGLRFFTVYGPWGRPDMALFLFTKAILEHKPIKVFNYGQMKRDFTYIDDIVEGIIRLIHYKAMPNPSWSGNLPDPGTSSAPYRVYNIGNNQPVTIMDFIQAIEDKLGIRAEKVLHPIQPGDVPETYADIADLMNDVGFKPETPIEAGIGKFVDWYKEYYGIR